MMVPFIGSLETIYKDALIAARSNEAVLISGETGAGKEVLARYIHENSARAKSAFIPINCAAIPSQLIESELFGHEPGAYTGATKEKKGLIQEAHCGTVLLDEIAELPADAQAKLLRVLETKKLLRLGSTKYREIDVRFIAATNADLKTQLETGQLRRDLYYRISIFVYMVPPLRERFGDISLLSQYILAELVPFDTPTLSPAVLELFLCYPWPGNIRELRNALTLAVARGEGSSMVQPQHLPEDIVSRCKHPDVLASNNLEEKTSCFEENLLKQMIARYPTVKEAAEHMGMGVRTLYRKLKKYHISSD